MDLLGLEKGSAKLEILEKYLPEFLWFIRQAEYNIDQARSFYKLLDILPETNEALKEVHNEVLTTLVLSLDRLRDAHGLEEYKP